VSLFSKAFETHLTKCFEVKSNIRHVTQSHHERSMTVIGRSNDKDARNKARAEVKDFDDGEL